MGIRVLDAATIGRIAAGEVVERPVSVAKELIENSLDAGATAITVEMRGGGIDLLRVSDNGCGIAPEEAKLAFENHATSKFSSGGDLYDIATLGFRGEALSSIAAVSKVEMQTTRRGSISGTKIRIAEGRFLETGECGARDGTTIIIRDLFFNIPVRRAFLKSAKYEGALVTELVTKLMLGNPGVSIRLINNGATTHQSFGDGKMLHVAWAVYGRELASQMIQVDEFEGGFRISGLIGVGDCARATRSEQCFFINGRLVRCPLLSSALEEACKGRVMINKYPMCALHLHMPPSSVDINVHPNKLEVRFRDEAMVRQSVAQLFERALAGGGMLDIKQLQQQQPEPYERPQIEIKKQSATESKQTEASKQKKASENKQTDVPNKQTEVCKSDDEHLSTKQSEEASQLRYNISQSMAGIDCLGLREESAPAVLMWQNELTDSSFDGNGRLVEPADLQADDSSFNLIGVAFDTYLLVEIEGAVLIIDQHAAHERLLYEKYKTMLETDNVAQQLLTPMVFSVSKREMELLIDNQTLLYEIGYDVQPFGERDVQVRSVPHVLGQAELRPLFLLMIEQLDRLKTTAYERRRQDIIKFSCKRAVKAGDRLSQSEIEALLSDMQSSQAPPTCPHGRPVVKKITKAEIERMFKRA